MKGNSDGLFVVMKQACLQDVIGTGSSPPFYSWRPASRGLWGRPDCCEHDVSAVHVHQPCPMHDALAAIDMGRRTETSGFGATKQLATILKGLFDLRARRPKAEDGGDVNLCRSC